MHLDWNQNLKSKNPTDLHYQPNNSDRKKETKLTGPHQKTAPFTIHQTAILILSTITPS